MMKVIAALSLWIALISGISSAQEPGGGLYLDVDPAAMAFLPGPGMKGKFRENLNKAIQRNPRDASALAHRAYLLQHAGDPARAQSDWDRAAAAAAPGSTLERRVLWSRGWARYDSGDVAGAMQDWQRAQALHGGAPFWAAYTYALGHAALGQMDEAIAWYDIAAKSNPDWQTERGWADRTSHWRAPQRAVMRTVFDAWSAQRTASAGPEAG